MLGKLLQGGFKIIKRAFTKDGGGLIKLIGDEGRLSWVYVGAIAVRILTAAAAIWLAGKLGVTPEQLIELANTLTATGG